MYQFDDVGSMYLSLPPNLQNVENECFSYAFDRQIKKLHKLAKKLTVWSDLDNADSRYYDHMALSIRVPYYRSEYNEKQKLKLIKSTLGGRVYAGTVKAVEELLMNSILHAKFIPWYEYDGKPYHFKIATSDDPDAESRVRFADMLQRVKAARSIIDGVEIDHAPVENRIYIGTGMSWMRIVQIPNREEIGYRIAGALYAGCVGIMKKQIVIERGDMDDKI